MGWEDHAYGNSGGPLPHSQPEGAPSAPSLALLVGVGDPGRSCVHSPGLCVGPDAGWVSPDGDNFPFVLSIPCERPMWRGLHLETLGSPAPRNRSEGWGAEAAGSL